jgi:hypothetical protein
MLLHSFFKDKNLQRARQIKKNCLFVSLFFFLFFPLVSNLHQLSIFSFADKLASRPQGSVLTQGCINDAKNYNFDKTISRKVLENYLSRAITMDQMFYYLSSAGQEDLRMIRNIGAKFLGRVSHHWSEYPADDAQFFREVKDFAASVHKADPDIILQAAVFESIQIDLNKIPVPDWVFKEFSLPVQKRNFKYHAMLYKDGRFVNYWGLNDSVPDMSRIETKMWFYYRACSYINAGYEAIHFGQVHLMDLNDPQHQHWMDILTRVRGFAAKRARRHLVLCDAHTHGVAVGDKLLFDFHAFPLRPKEVTNSPQKAVLEVGYTDAIYGQSKGGQAPSGWRCSHLPYLVEFDNWGSSGKGGTIVGWPWVWGYDEICWLAHQSASYRNYWLRYAWNWVRKNDKNGWVEMPGKRYMADPIGGNYIYWANRRSTACPFGFNQEDTIKSIWAKDN